MARIVALFLAFASALAFLFEGAAAKEDFERMLQSTNGTAAPTTTKIAVTSSAIPMSHGVPALAAVVLVCQGLRA